MQEPLENLTKSQLLSLLQKQEKSLQQEAEKLMKVERNLAQKEHKISDLEFQLAYYKRLAFGQKRERFEGDKNQMSLPFEMEPQKAEKQEAELKALSSILS